MQQLTHLSLFSGIGGLDLAAEAAGFETVGQCEWADYPTRVLEKHWPDVPRWRDIRTLTGDSFYERTGLRTVDIISGGFPCQPFSVAGKQRGKDDDRFLWPEMARVISELRPTWVVGENVAGIVRLALDDVLADLEGKGYTTRTFLIPAASVGAPHLRYRTAIVGYSEHNGLSATAVAGSPEEAGGGKQEGTDTASKFERAGEPRDGKDVADSLCIDWKCCGSFKNETGNPKLADESSTNRKNVADTDNTTSTRYREHSREIHGIAKPKGSYICCRSEWWSAEPSVGRVADGIPNRVDRLKCLGNAVVPQQFYPVFQAIATIELSR